MVSVLVWGNGGITVWGSDFVAVGVSGDSQIFTYFEFSFLVADNIFGNVAGGAHLFVFAISIDSSWLKRFPSG